MPLATVTMSTKMRAGGFFLKSSFMNYYDETGSERKINLKQTLFFQVNTCRKVTATWASWAASDHPATLFAYYLYGLIFKINS